LAARSGADWQREYPKAVSKVEDRRYAEAIPFLQRALQEQPASCPSCIREGMSFSDYFPNLYLGQATVGTGRTEEAKSASTPEPQARPASPAFDPAALAALKAKLSKIRRQVKDVNPIVLQGFSGFDALHRKLADRLSQGLQRADRVQNRKDIDDLNGYATRLQGNVRRFLDAFEKVRNLRDTFNALPEETLKQFPDLHRQYTFIRDQINEYKSSAHDWESGQPYQDLMQAMDSTQREVTRLRGLFSAKLAEVSHKPARAAPTSPASVVSDSRPSRGAPAPEPQPAINAPAILKDAFASYFRGDFSAADASLKSLEYLNISHPYLHFLQAVLAGSRYFAGGEQDTALGQKARDSFNKARAAGLPSSAISETYFSPKVIAFLQGK